MHSTRLVTKPKNTWKDNSEEKPPSELPAQTTENNVPGVLYDLRKKKVVGLRKSSHDKDQSLKYKDEAIEMLAKKVETLTMAMEVEAKKMIREVAAIEKEVIAVHVNKALDNRAKRSSSNTKNSSNTAQILAVRAAGRNG
ncbi:Microtubule-associated protein 70-1 [Cardamine amara subsp. amara]|uniref:Microtubule-associated protein 70-1 n=1 Tax=Cardamine amara subsp. amara TaxID=228776 RepID=A0ABD0Z8L4_CARAN